MGVPPMMLIDSQTFLVGSHKGGTPENWSGVPPCVRCRNAYLRPSKRVLKPWNRAKAPVVYKIPRTMTPAATP